VGNRAGSTPALGTFILNALFKVAKIQKTPFADPQWRFLLFQAMTFKITQTS
jgi:hypothetical protein